MTPSRRGPGCRRTVPLAAVTLSMVGPAVAAAAVTPTWSNR